MSRRGGCLLAVLVVLLTACGGSGSSTVASGSSDTTQTSVEAPTTATTPAPAASSTSAGPSTTKPKPKVTLPAGGPRGPVDPPNTPAYQLLTMGGTGCQQLLTEVNKWPRASAADPSVNGVEDRLFYLYRAAAEACLLKWADAKADFDKLQALKPAATFGTACSSADVRNCEKCHRLVLDWLTTQLAAYKADPTYAPTFLKSSGPSPCPESTSTTATTRAVTTTTTTTTTLRR
jgi:hypothetical protein